MASWSARHAGSNPGADPLHTEWPAERLHIDGATRSVNGLEATMRRARTGAQSYAAHAADGIGLCRRRTSGTTTTLFAALDVASANAPSVIAIKSFSPSCGSLTRRCHPSSTFISSLTTMPLTSIPRCALGSPSDRATPTGAWFGLISSRLVRQRSADIAQGDGRVDLRANDEDTTLEPSTPIERREGCSRSTTRTGPPKRAGRSMRPGWMVLMAGVVANMSALWR